MKNFHNFCEGTELRMDPRVMNIIEGTYFTHGFVECVVSTADVDVSIRRLKRLEIVHEIFE